MFFYLSMNFKSFIGSTYIHSPYLINNLKWQKNYYIHLDRIALLVSHVMWCHFHRHEQTKINHMHWFHFRYRYSRVIGVCCETNIRSIANLSFYEACFNAHIMTFKCPSHFFLFFKFSPLSGFALKKNITNNITSQRTIGSI